MRVAALFCLCVLSAKAQTITRGGTYITSSFFSVQTTEPVVMDHCSWNIGDGQSLITAACQGANVVIQNSSFTFAGSNPSVGQLLNVPNIWAFRSFVVHNCFFDGRGQAGFYQLGGYNTTSAVIRAYGNIFQNCRCALGLNGVRNDPNISFSWNQIAVSGSNKWTDQISIYNSCGVPGSEIIVEHNYIQVDPASPRVPLSSGMSLGDTGSCYVIGVGNVLVNCNATLWAQNGNTSKLLSNRIAGTGPADEYSNGLALFAGAGYAIGNSVAWLDTLDGVVNNYYFGSGTGEAANSNADPSLISNPYQTMFWLWESERLAAKQTVGSQ